jgi:hypothetical protein
MTVELILNMQRNRLLSVRRAIATRKQALWQPSRPYENPPRNRAKIAEADEIIDMRF